MKNIVTKCLAKLMIPFLVFLNCPVYAASVENPEKPGVTTEVIHKPAEQLEAGKRIEIYAEIEDSKGVDLARVYFKSVEGANYNFVPMMLGEKIEKGMFEKFKQLGSNFEGSAYTAILPAPANGSKAIEYLLLVKNSDNVVVKTQTYSIKVKDSDQQATLGEPINVYTEMAEAPTELTGFADNIAFDVVESAGKFGAVAGLYSLIGSDSTAAVSGGSIAASSGGFTTAAVVVAGVATVAVVGGAAAAGGGGGGGGGGGAGGELTAQSIVGNWNFVERVNTGQTFSGQVTFNNNGTWSASTGTAGTWSLNGTTLTMQNSSGAGGQAGNVSGSSNAFTLTTSNSTVTFSR